MERAHPWERFIEFYFDIGLKYKDIRLALASRHGFEISERHLKRVLSARGHTRRKDYSELAVLVEYIRNELLYVRSTEVDSTSEYRIWVNSGSFQQPTHVLVATQPSSDSSKLYGRAMEEDLETFLRSRQVPQEDIMKMKRDKVGVEYIAIRKAGERDLWKMELALMFC